METTHLTPILKDSHLEDVSLTWLPADGLPQPYRRLLAHDHDMTSELAEFHGDAITLTVLRSQQHADLYLREVTLHANGSTVEYGLIAIHLDALPPELRPLVIEGNIPFGTILNDARLPYRSKPQGFLSVPATSIADIFSGGTILYGRYNHLIHNETNQPLARIIEILPKT